MKSLFKRIMLPVAGLATIAVLLNGCNKDLPAPTPIVPPAATGQTIATLLNDPSFSILKAAATRAGLIPFLSDPTAVLTVFAPDDAAFIASGIPAAAISALRPGFLDTVLKYHIIGGQELKAASISEKFPNMYLQSSFVLQAPSASLPPGYRMPICISRRGGNAWANNIPVIQADIDASNGVIHKVARVIAPPSQVIAQIAATNPDLSYLVAAITRADQGPPAGAPQLMPILSNPAANLTVFAPTNLAFQGVLQALGLPPDISSINLLPTQTVWGIVAYHVLGSRAFAANLPSGNSTVASLIGVPIQTKVAVTAPLPPTSVELRGAGNVLPTTPPTPYFSMVTTGDVHAINGVVHVVNAVLLPQ